MNIGLEKARGKYISILESDDFIEKDMLKKLYSRAKHRGNPDIVKSSYWLYFDTGGGNGRKEPAPLIWSISQREVFNIYDHPEIMYGHPSIWTCLYRKDFLEINNIRFKEAPGGGWVDNPFMLETLLRAETICWMPDAFYCYRQTNPNASSFIKDCSMPFERTSEMLGILDREHVNSSDIRNPVYKRILWNTVSALHNPNYVPEKDDSLIISQLKCIDPTYLDNKWVTQEEKDAYDYFSKKGQS